MGALERPSHDKKLGTFISAPLSLETGEGLEIELIIDHAYMMKPPLKIPKVQSW